ncbi:secreted RxLR effector peptide protein, putative [Phytophthora infestans T30-4]|uniref:Secreted RxLR effector peptide protein, putative n=1 Tax=Phytophthora infestans (strain T30-4) TaxID=403677 RepID=D0NQ71_PHYIT|nr:secreted RxLR effector peptide protein, putative [Phytophthora infestans T30-4]EEY62803.1 secreted RxLR effector peptide protein, putative [Phytophthora infestans T30-4]|eukprot:XP_002898678.1 secreted RxLR effector peptide protein, putative [Phytophthora infestans T30-4]
MSVCYIVPSLVFIVALSFMTSSCEAKTTVHIYAGQIKKRHLRSYGVGDVDMKDKTSGEERAGSIDPKTIADLLQADDIVSALKSHGKLDVLFARLAQDENAAKEIVSKLSANGKIIENMSIIDKLNNARTSVNFNQKLTDWLDTKTLDELVSALRAFRSETMTHQFREWYYTIGKTPEDLSAAIATIKNENKRKGFGALAFHFKMFVQREENNAKMAAENAAAI